MAIQEPQIRIRFDRDCRNCEPGETLSGEFFLEGSPAWEWNALEVSILWYTEGKGDLDFAIHDFWRLQSNEIAVPTGYSENVIAPGRGIAAGCAGAPPALDPEDPLMRSDPVGCAVDGTAVPRIPTATTAKTNK